MINLPKRSEEEVEEVLRLYSDMVYKIALSYMKNVQSAEDAYQNTFLRYMESDKVFSSEEYRKAWLIRVTFNECKKIYRQAFYRYTVPIESVSESMLEIPEYHMDEVWDEIMKLPLKYRKVLHLFYYEEMSVRQISEILRVKEGTVTSQLSRARQMLKRCLVI